MLPFLGLLFGSATAMQVTTGAGAVQAVHGVGGFLSRVGLIGQDHSDGGQYTPVAEEGDEGLPASSGEPYLPAQLRQPAGLNEMKTGVTPPADGEALRFAMAELGGASASAGLPAQLSQPVETDEKMGVTPRAAPSRQESAAGPGAAPSCTGFTMPTGVPPGVHLLPPYYNPAFLQAGQGGNSMWGIAPPSASDGAHEAPEGECVGYVPMWVAVPYPNGADLRGRASVLGGMVTPDRPASVKLKTAAAPEAEEVGEAEQLPRHTVDQDQELIANWLAHWQRTGTADIPSMMDVNMLQRYISRCGTEEQKQILRTQCLLHQRTMLPPGAVQERKRDACVPASPQRTTPLLRQQSSKRTTRAGDQSPLVPTCYSKDPSKTRQQTIIGPKPVSDTDDELLAKGQLFQWRKTAPSDATDEEREWFEEVILDNRRLQEVLFTVDPHDQVEQIRPQLLASLTTIRQELELFRLMQTEENGGVPNSPTVWQQYEKSIRDHQKQCEVQPNNASPAHLHGTWSPGSRRGSRSGSHIDVQRAARTQLCKFWLEGVEQRGSGWHRFGEPQRPCRNGPQRCSHAHGFMGCWANNWKTVLCQAADHPAWHKPCKYSKHAMADLLTSQRGGSCRECGISEEDQAALPAKCNRAHGIEEARKSETRLVPKFRGGKQPGGPALAEACAEDIEWDEVTFSQHPLDHAADLLPAGVREANGGLIPLEVLHEMKLMPLGDPNRGGDLSESMRRKVNDEQRRYFAEKHITDETITYAIRTVVKLFDKVRKERDSAAFQGQEYWQWILQRFDMVFPEIPVLEGGISYRDRLAVYAMSFRNLPALWQDLNKSLELPRRNDAESVSAGMDVDRPVHQLFNFQPEEQGPADATAALEWASPVTGPVAKQQASLVKTRGHGGGREPPQKSPGGDKRLPPSGKTGRGSGAPSGKGGRALPRRDTPPGEESLMLSTRTPTSFNMQVGQHVTPSTAASDTDNMIEQSSLQRRRK